MAEWTIEPLTSVSEIDDIVAIEEASFTNPWTREMYVAELNKPEGSYCFLARLDGQAIGFCSCWLIVDEVHINNLAVLPRWRRQGVAMALLDRVLHHGIQMGATRATLEVRRSNDPARLLYERMGFVVAGVRRAYYSKPVEDAIILWREALGRP